MAIPIRYNLATWRAICTKLDDDDTRHYIEEVIADMADWEARVLVPIWLTASQRNKVYKIIRGH